MFFSGTSPKTSQSTAPATARLLPGDPVPRMERRFRSIVAQHRPALSDRSTTATHRVVNASGRSGVSTDHAQPLFYHLRATSQCPTQRQHRHWWTGGRDASDPGPAEQSRPWRHVHHVPAIFRGSWECNVVGGVSAAGCHREGGGLDAGDAEENFAASSQGKNFFPFF